MMKVCEVLNIKREVDITLNALHLFHWITLICKQTPPRARRCNSAIFAHPTMMVKVKKAKFTLEQATKAQRVVEV